MKKIGRNLLVIAVVMLIATVGFARKGGPGGKKGDGRDMHDRGPRIHSIAHTPAGKLAGIDTIMEKYQIKIQRVYLDAKEEKLGLKSKMRDTGLKLHAYAVDYKEDPKSVKRSKVVAELKEMNTLQKKMHSIQKNAMGKIKTLNDKRDAEISTALDKWLKKIETNQDEFEKFMNLFQQGRPKNHHKGRPNKPMR